MSEKEKINVLSDTERQRIDEALEAILATEKFEAAPQMSAFLRYVVAQAADGNQNRIKAFTVAVDALGKPDSFDPQNDPVVRVLAGRLRAALTAYNEENANAPVIITMTPGSYVPSFKTRKLQDARPEAVELHDSSTDEQKSPDGGISDFARPETVTSAGKQEAPHNSTCRETFNIATHVTPDVRQGHSAETGNVDCAGSRSRQPAHTALPHGNPLAGRISRLLTLPNALITCAIAALLWVGMVQYHKRSDTDLSLLAAKPAIDNRMASTSIRNRPSMPAVFISAINQGNALENSLNTLVSSVISESEQVHVFRILDTDSDLTFWPEDYILTLTTLDLPNERQVNMQLMEADTGRIIHSRSVSLKEQSDDQLTQHELSQVIDAALEIVRESGPLMRHYASNRQEP